MVSCRFGGSNGYALDLDHHGDLVVVRSNRRGARHDLSPLDRRSRAAMGNLVPLFGFPASGVGVYAAPAGGADELASVIDADPEVQFAGQGMRDRFGAPSSTPRTSSSSSPTTRLRRTPNGCSSGRG